MSHLISTVRSQPLEYASTYQSKCMCRTEMCVYVSFGDGVLICISVRVPTALINHHDQKQLGEERVSFTSRPVRSPSSGKSGQDLEAGPDAQASEECCLLSCSPGLAQTAFFTVRITHPGVAQLAVGLGLSQSSIKKTFHRPT